MRRIAARLPFQRDSAPSGGSVSRLRQWAAKGRFYPLLALLPEALEGPEAEELERARKAAAQGKSLHRASGGVHPDEVPDERDPHTESNLDKGLEETFPASDPVSISPGAD